MDQKLRQRLKEISQYRHALPPLAQLRRSVQARQGEAYDSLIPTYSELNPPSLSPDAPLNALAQLAALRLDCERVFISIIDDRTQHVIAEATQSISVFDQHVHRADDGLCLGLQSLPSKRGGCPSNIRIFSGEPNAVLEGLGSTADDSCIIITDLDRAASAHDFPLLAHLPKRLRFYVEVPLKIESGHVLGSLCVVDPVSRDLGLADIASLQEVAKLVLQHLESSIVREDQRRAERLMQGLAHFVQGRSSLSQWSQSAPDQTPIASLVQQSTDLSTANVRQDHAASEPSQRSRAVKADSEIDSISSKTATGTSTGENLESARATDTPATSKADAAEAGTSLSGPAQVEVGFDPVPDIEETDDLHPPTMASINIRQAFARASNLIRESLDLDATSFLEVPQNERYKSMNSNRAQNRESQEAGGSTPEDSELSADSSNEISPENQTPNPSTDSPLATAPDDSLCYRLGYSTRLKSSLVNSSTTQRFMTISARLLNRLSSKYPQGRIFHFDVAGGLSSSDEDKRRSQKQSAGAQRSKRVADELFDLFPSARSLIFLPLYDNSRQHVYAGFFGWTASAARYLQKHEIVYVSGFANSVMCEVMRLGAVATDKAKSDFISSISHELRSPLHGILAAGQLLSESQVDRIQAGYVQMVENCATTLLDIMNHLLDHAKINQFRERQVHGKRSKTASKHVVRPQTETYSLVTGMDLVSIIEETVTSMTVASRTSIQEEAITSPMESPLNTTLGFTNKAQSLFIPVIFNIQPHQNWNLNSEPGSWRRIVMNLVGNSLKYTQKGHIELSLHLHARSSSSEGNSWCVIELRIKDTGQGMSEDYLKHRLYTPFAQEDNLSVGAGLGLSLVRQIVSSLRGKIQVQSEAGTGTEVIVQIPVDRSELPLSTTIGAELLTVTRHKEVACFGFDKKPSIFENPTGILDPHAAALLSLQSSVLCFARDWFEMKLTSSQPDIYIIEETFLETCLDQFDRHGNRLLVIGLDGSNYMNTKLSYAEHVYMVPPLGPKQLGNAFKDLIEAKLTQNVMLTATQPSTFESPSEHHDPDTTKPASSSRTKGRTRPSLAVGIAPAAASAPLESQKRVVLLVDDNEINLRLLIACATRLKAVEYITAVNGKEALEKYQSTVESGTVIDTVFMDISMPVMNGFESTRNIRAYEKAKGLSQTGRAKIIALTGLASAEAQDQIDECGFDVYLRKPVNVKTLREMLSS